MIGVINFFIGIAMAAGAALKGILGSNGGSSFISSLGGQLLGASSEFIGDATQGFIGKIVKRIKENKAGKKAVESMSKLVDSEKTEKFRNILRELSENNGENSKKTKKRNLKKQEKKNAKFIATISKDILFGFDLKEYLNQNSLTFRSEDSDTKESFILIINTAIKVYNRDMFFNLDNDLQVVAQVIVASLGEQFDVKLDEIKELLSFAANQNGGKFNLEKIEIDKYAPKYILNQCPECGYSGDRLYINEHDSMTYCAACGSSYSIAKYCEPELWEKFEMKLENLGSSLKDLGNGAENIQTEIESLAENNHEIKGLLQNGLEQVVTQKYLENILNGEFEKQNKSIEDLLKNAFQEYYEQIGNRMKYLLEGQSQAITNIKSVITEINKNIEEGNAELSNQIVLMNENLLDFRDNTYKKLDEQGTQLKDILETVKSLEQNGFYNKLTKAMEGMKEEFIKEATSEIGNIDKINGNLDSIKDGISQLLKNQVRKIPSEYDKYNETEREITCPYCGIKGEIEHRDNRLYFHCNVCENEFLNIKPDYIRSNIYDVMKWVEGNDLSEYLANDTKIAVWVRAHTPKIDSNCVHVNNIKDVLIVPGHVKEDMSFTENDSRLKKIIVSAGAKLEESQLNNIPIIDEIHIYKQKGGIFIEQENGSRFQVH